MAKISLKKIQVRYLIKILYNILQTAYFFEYFVNCNTKIQ